MDLELKNKIVVVTGGAKGIGAAIVRTAAAEGAIPVIVDRDVEAGNHLHHQIAGSDLILAELSEPQACYSVVQKTIEKHGRLDALVNNAGINDKVGLEHGSPEQYVESLGRNLLHYYNMAHYALPHLKKSRGCIVNVSSKTALTGQGGTSGYASSKGAILALTREWAAELLGYGIRVNAVVPAEVMTPLYRQWLDSFPQPEEKLKNILGKIPLDHRMTEPEEIAAMVVFLLSVRAGHITGQHVFVDGGYVHLDRALT
ncbi:MAG TPA: SDR family oxidoreductase [Terriglobales bacterium]|nr:SDR family oxidoreductase [Terriglobales bacterium]